MNHPHCTNKDYTNIAKWIEDINTKIQGDNEAERERLEMKAIEEIKLNPKAFFKYANKTKKNKSKIGPIRSGNNFYSDPLEMAKILSNQYASVFSKPRGTYEDIQFLQRSIEPIKN